MKSFNKFLLFISLFTFMFFGVLVTNINAQAEVMAWGNITGIRSDGELVKFESKLVIAKKGWRNIFETAKEKQQPSFIRENGVAVITSQLDNISLKETVADIAKGTAKVEIEFSADSTTDLEGAFFCLEISPSVFHSPKINLINGPKEYSFDPPVDNKNIREWLTKRYDPVKADGINIKTEQQSITIETEKQSDIIVLKGIERGGNPNTQILIPAELGKMYKETSAKISLVIKTSAKPDKEQVTLSLDMQNPGKAFDGIGGNFRLQNMQKDPLVIDYCLDNLNVTWGRVEMPWQLWHPDEDVNPIEIARAGNINKHVHQSMLMAQKLAKQKIHVIVSTWSAPEWAIVGKPQYGEAPDGTRGNPLDKSKMQSIVKSIGSYILYLKEAYGVEAEMFSFNESDLGINIRQTSEEHAQLIKDLGSYFASKKLATKILLGDNSDANTYSFTNAAVNDHETRKYIGAVSFHSWRGCDNWTLSIWKDIADAVNVPLLVGEGSTDAAAWKYPQVFLEPTYALYEIDTYVRILSVCQAKSILQWQLTSDYSVMTGNGINGTDGPMKPTQRFWQLKQLGLTPKGSFNIPIKSSNPDISSCAFADIANGIYSIHMVNNGSKREALIENIPIAVKQLKKYFTNAENDMKSIETLNVVDGKVTFTIEPVGFTTLINN